MSIGCATCHMPALTTDSRVLTYSFPEVATATSRARARTGRLAPVPGW